MNTLIIIPTHNEEENIEKIIIETQKTLLEENFSILVVDDKSQDNTVNIVDNLIKKHKNINIIKRNEKLGLANAYVAGFKYGLENNYDVLIQMDADFSHHPKYLKDMIKEIKHNDVVIASRNIKGGDVAGWSILRNIISKGGSLYSRLILNCNIKDLTGGYNAWRKEVIEAINLNNILSKGYSFQIEMKYKAYKQGYKIKEIPIIFEDRKYGKSKMSKAIFFEAMLNVIKIKLLNK